MLKNQEYKHSVKVNTDDITALYCIRAVAMYAQRSGNNKVPWGGTGDKIWANNKNSVVFRFTSKEFRELFKKELKRLLPNDLYYIIEENDNNPPSENLD